jgi:hypothetical protein
VRVLVAVGTLLAALAAGAPASAGAAAPLTWSAPVAADAAAVPTSVSCPTDTLCVAVDPAGNLITSTDPEASAPTWTAAVVSPHPLTAVSCASSSLCVAVDGSGRAYTSLDPAGGASTWSGADVDAGHALNAVSCPESSFCIAVDDAGQVLKKPFPAGSWSTPQHIDGAALSAVSCATATRCAAVDTAGNVLDSVDGGASWQSHPASRGVALRSLSCPLAGLCAALDAEGDVLASADPWSAPPQAPTWATTDAGLGGSPAAISCAASGLCVAVDGGEGALASDNPAAPVPQWSESHSPGARLATLSCLPSGACIAFNGFGRAVTGRVPAPQPSTVAPTETTSAGATLSGTLNPEDALVTGCWFEYGTTSSYGAIAPCSASPAPGSAPVPVSVQIGGLAPNSVYHYRLVGSSAIAREAGSDVQFTTAASPTATLLIPHPSIHGTPAVGQRLTCSPGVSGALRLSYAWFRDLVPVGFQTASTYLVKGIDSGHHIQCAVTASSAGGDSTARSAFVTIPVGGVPVSAGETSIGSPHLHGHTLLVPVSCSARASHGCNVSLRLTAASGRRTVTLGSARAFVARGAQRTVALNLTKSARKLLAARHRLQARLTATGTVIGVIEGLLSVRAIQLGPASHGASRTSHGSRR